MLIKSPGLSTHQTKNKPLLILFFLSKNITPFGDGAVDLNHKMYLIALFRLINNNWEFDRTEIDLDNL